MKKEKFTNEEIELLKVFLKLRIENDRKRNVKVKPKYNSTLLSTYDKLVNEELSDYSSTEKIILQSIGYENLLVVNGKLKLNSATAWLNITEEQEKVSLEIDIIYSILEKCGFYPNNNKFILKHELGFRYSNRLELIRKLKKSEEIFLSKTNLDDNDVIVFVYENKEYVQFNLGFPVTLDNIEFKPFNSSLSSRYTSSIMTKKEASECLLSCEKEKYPEDVLDFYQLLLN